MGKENEKGTKVKLTKKLEKQTLEKVDLLQEEFMKEQIQTLKTLELVNKKIRQ